MLLAAVLCGCGASPLVGEGEGGESSGGLDFEPMPPCSAVPEGALLVAGDSDRVVILRADGSTIELATHAPGLADAERWVSFTATGGGVVTLSEAWSAGTVLRRVTAFDFDGQATWVRDWEGGNGFDSAAFASPDGETIFFGFDYVLHVVRQDQVREYPDLSVMASPTGTQLPVIQTSDGDHTGVGWLDMDTGELELVPITGVVQAHRGQLIGINCSEPRHVQLGDPDGSVTTIALPSEGPCTDRLLLQDDWAILLDNYSFESIVRVELSTGAAWTEALDPPAGLASFPCGWGSASTDGDLLLPVTDGATISAMRRSPDGGWTPLEATPLSGAVGGAVVSRGGSYGYWSFRRANPCSDEEFFAPVEGTVQGNSLQLVRPSSGTHLSWQEQPTFAYPHLGFEGRCAAWEQSDGRLIVVDMDRGSTRTLRVPTESVSFPNNDGHWTRAAYLRQ